MQDTPGKPIPVTGATLAEKVANAKTQLDIQFRETVQWHFNPETGTPFWLDKAKSFDFNPLTDIHTFDDIKKFPIFEDDWLRGGPVRRWVPKAYADRGVYVFETGGTTGLPASAARWAYKASLPHAQPRRAGWPLLESVRARRRGSAR